MTTTKSQDRQPVGITADALRDFLSIAPEGAVAVCNLTEKIGASTTVFRFRRPFQKPGVRNEGAKGSNRRCIPQTVTLPLPTVEKPVRFVPASLAVQLDQALGREGQGPAKWKGIRLVKGGGENILDDLNLVLSKRPGTAVAATT